MKYVHVEDLEEGMVLGADLTGSGGRVMLQKGAVIKEKYFRTLKVWGISGVYIESDEEEEFSGEETFSGLSEETVTNIFAFLEYRSGGLSYKDPLLKEIFRIGAERIARDVSQTEEKTFVPEYPPSERPKIFLARKKEVVLKDLLESNQKLFSLPDIYFKVRQIIESPRSSAAHIARVVEKDTSLSAKLLQIVNSAFYGFPSRIDSISRAVTIIGSSELATLSLAVSVTSLFKGIPKAFIDMRSFWEHSIATGVFARVLADKGGIKSEEERLFLAGILHDLGRISFFRHVPAEMADAMAEALRRKIPLCEAEHDEFGFTHAIVGGKLLESWKIPRVLWDMVRYHHTPERAENPMTASVLHLADFMANIFSFGTGGSFFLPRFSPEALEHLQIDPSELASVVLQGERQIREILHVFTKKTEE